MKQQVNKNGIPILDGPVNGLRKARPCMPDQHHYQYISYDAKIHKHQYRCSTCGEEDFQSKGDRR